MSDAVVGEELAVMTLSLSFLAEKNIPRKPTRFSCLLPSTQELMEIKSKKKVWAVNVL